MSCYSFRWNVFLKTAGIFFLLFVAYYNLPAKGRSSSEWSAIPKNTSASRNFDMLHNYKNSAILEYETKTAEFHNGRFH